MRDEGAAPVGADWRRRLADGVDARRLVLWAPVAFGLGAQLYFLLRAEPPVWSAPAAVLAAIILTRLGWVGERGFRVASLAAALCLMGFGTASLRAHLVAAPVLAIETNAAVEGTILAIDQSRAGLPRLLLGAPRIYGVAAEATPVRVRATLRSARYAEGLRPGDRVSILARLGPPGGPVEPGAFDFRRGAWFDRLGAVGLARGPAALIARDEGWSLAGMRFDLGATLRERMPGEAGAFAAALTVGDRAGLPPEALQALRDANLAHLLAISGLHMSIVCGLAFFSVRLGLAMVPGLALRWPLKKIAAGAALAVGLGYLGLSGASVATERAFIMVAVALCAVLVDRPAVTLRALALAALIVLARAPESLTEVGFQMSFAATLALVATYEFVRERGGLRMRREVGRRVAVYLGALVLTSLVAGLATAPFAAFHFNRLTHYGLPANLAATPALGFVVAPALCLAAFAAPFGLEGPFLKLAGLGIGWILDVSRWIAALPAAARPVPAAAPIALWMIVFGGLLLCLVRAKAVRVAALTLGGAGVALSLAGAPRPTVLVAQGGAPVGVLSAQGRLLLEPARSIYAVESWLRRDGDAAAWRDAAAREGARRAGAWIEVEGPTGQRIALHLGRRPDMAGASSRCAAPGVVITPGFDWIDIGAQDVASAVVTAALLASYGEAPIRPSVHGSTMPARCLGLDRTALANSGPLAIFFADDAATVAVAPAQGRRLWSGSPPGR